MWEDTFTGVFKFRGRWLVHSSHLPEEAFARLQAARSGTETTSAMKGVSPPPSKYADHFDGDEVFLTDKVVDLDISIIVKPLALFVDDTAKIPPTVKNKVGPRLTHAFDASSGDFIAVGRTDAILKRARARCAEAFARASILAEEAAAAKSGKPVTRSSGWLLPKRSTKLATVGPRENGGWGVTPSVSMREPKPEEGSYESAKTVRDETLTSDEVELAEEKHDDADSGELDHQLSNVVEPRGSASTQLVAHDKDVGKSPFSPSSSVDPVDVSSMVGPCKSRGKGVNPSASVREAGPEEVSYESDTTERDETLTPDEMGLAKDEDDGSDSDPDHRLSNVAPRGSACTKHVVHDEDEGKPPFSPLSVDPAAVDSTVGPRESRGGGVTPSASVREAEPRGASSKSDTTDTDENLTCTEMELAKDEHDLSDSGDLDHRLSNVSLRGSPSTKHVIHDKDVGKSPFSPSSVNPTALASPAVSPPDLLLAPSPSGHQGSACKRPRRLAMPPADGESGLSKGHEENIACRVRTGKDSAGAMVSVSVAPAKRSLLVFRSVQASKAPDSLAAAGSSPSMLQSSTTGNRKRIRLANAAAWESGSRYRPRHTPVGDDHQVVIPDLLSVRERKNDATRGTTPADAKMVWRSIRGWDPKSRRMLSIYLNEAKKVVHTIQVCPGRPVHVRLSSGANASVKRGGGDETSGTGVTNSYALWGVTAGRGDCGEVRVACSQRTQTDVPVSAIQEVQSEEEALSALIKARCTLDDFGPALQILANDGALPPSLEPWTLKQVQNLEKALEKGFDQDRPLHGLEKIGADRQDFIDLSFVSRQIPGKSPTQVLSFYYRYLAAAEPLTDIVYGPTAAKARSIKPTSPVHSTKDVARPASSVITPPITPRATNATTTALPTASPSHNNASVAILDNRSIRDTRTNLMCINSLRVVASTNNAVATEKGSQNPASHKCSPTPIGTRTGADAPSHARASTVAADHSFSCASDRLAGRIERQRAARGKVGNSDEMLQAARTTSGSTYATTLEAKGQAELVSRGASGQAHSHPMTAEASRDSRFSFSRGASTVAYGTTTHPPASYGSGSVVVNSTRAGYSQMTPPIAHTATQHRGDFDERQIGDVCRDRPAIVKKSSAVVKNSYAGYGRRKGLPQPTVDQHTFGFMTPCWRLLEALKDFMDEGQLGYMRGLILMHIQKPMTRAQLLERAESCLQEHDQQKKIYLAFVSTFDHLQQDVPLVPLYTTVKKAPSTQPEPTSYDRPPPLVAYPSVQALNYHGQQPAYSRAPAPSAFGVPPGTTVPGHSRSSVPVTTTPSQPYSRTVDVRRHSPAAPGTGGWGRESSTASGTTTSSGELVRSHRIPHSPYPFPNFHSASPLTTVSHGGRDGGSEARQINEGAWPQHQAHPEHSGAQSSNGASPLVPPNDNGHER